MMLDIINMVILPIIAGLLFNSFGYINKKIKRLLTEIFSFTLIIVIKNFIFRNTGEITNTQLFFTFIKDILLFIVFPISMGMLFRKLFKGKKEVVNSALSLVSMLGIAIIITIITAAGRESLLQIGILLIVACFMHNTFGYLLGYWFSKLLRLDERSCRTVAIEVGMQNGGLASGIALQMGKVATVGLAAAVFGPLMNITGSSLASWWRGKSVLNDKIQVMTNNNIL
jgi:bile acid:Na+ symporter, BASS family